MVAVSSLTLGGGGDEATDRAAFSLDAGEVVEDRAGTAESGAAEPNGTDAAAALEPEAALPKAGGDRLEAAAATGGPLQPVGDLSDTTTRARFLERVRDDPEVADLLAGGSRPSGWLEQARAALLAEGLPPACAATLLDGPERPALVLRADVEGVATIGAVTVDDGLQLTLVDPTRSCAVVVEQAG